jgi:hypothetical protein
MNKIIIYLIIIILLFSILYFQIEKKEYFKNSINSDNLSYLASLKSIPNQCLNMGLIPSYMEKICYVDGVLDPYANCKCIDKDGNCKICFPRISKYDKSTSVIYEAPNYKINNADSKKNDDLSSTINDLSSTINNLALFS